MRYFTVNSSDAQVTAVDDPKRCESTTRLEASFAETIDPKNPQRALSALFGKRVSLLCEVDDAGKVRAWVMIG